MPLYDTFNVTLCLNVKKRGAMNVCQKSSCKYKNDDREGAIAVRELVMLVRA